jgi:putative peptidoglycan lipid II flippase
MGGISRKISEVAGWTMASRLLGLARDILLFASLGTGPLNSAFILAFTLPNLFRRLLGEGALTSSSIPILSESLEKRGDKETYSLLNAILSRLGIGLLALQLVGIPAFFLISRIPGLEERWYYGADLSQWLFPYMVFICLGALVCGMLNVLGRFGLTAFNQVWLNLSIIVAILTGLWILPTDGWGRVILITAGVLVGGAFQLFVPAIGLMRSGWRPAVNLQPHDDLGRVLKLFLPGLLGAAIFQINILVSRFLAFSLDDTATGLLYLSSRLVELPLGVFAIAVTTVIFPELSRLSATGDEKGFAATFRSGLGLIFMITLPATFGLALMGEAVLGFLFQWGLFESRDVVAAYPVLVASAMGLPFFAWSSFLIRAWYARQEMKTPVRLAFLNLILNLVLGLILMQFLGAVGLALANTISSIVHCLLLQAFLPGRPRLSFPVRSVLSLSAGLAVLALICFYGQFIVGSLDLATKIRDLLAIVILIPLAAGAYFTILWIFRHPQLMAFINRQGE